MLLKLLIIVMVIGECDDLVNFDAQGNGNPSSSPVHTDISNTDHCVSVENMNSTT